MRTVRFISAATLAALLAACGGGQEAPPPAEEPTTALTEPESTPAADATTPAAEATTPAAAATDEATDDAAGGGTFTGTADVALADPADYGLPDDFPADVPVPAGGDITLRESSSTDFVDFTLEFGDGDPAALLAFVEEGFASNGWELSDSNSNTDQFGYDNENRQFTKGDLYANVTTWFPQSDDVEPFVDYFVSR